jgi:hypothetical protein
MRARGEAVVKWVVRRGDELLGVFATQGEALAFGVKAGECEIHPMTFVRKGAQLVARDV